MLLSHVMREISKFIAALFCCTALSTLLWAAFVTDRLYNCTDSGGLGFLSPGHWVHQPVAVHQVVAGRSMSEPDTIKQGWTVTRLWCLWYSFAAVSVLFSIVLAWTPWVPRRQPLQ